MEKDKGHMHVTLKVQIRLESSITLARKIKLNKNRKTQKKKYKIQNTKYKTLYSNTFDASNM
jgi:hypothetical protein